MSLDDIVNVTITRQTVAQSRAGFGLMLAFGIHKHTMNRVDWYASTTEMTTAGYSSTEELYKAAVDYFSQDPHPTKIGIGRIQASRQTVTIEVVQNTTHYIVYIESATPGTKTPHDYTSDSDATKTEIVDGLVALINAGAEAARVTASNVGDNLQIDGDDASYAFVVTVNSTTLMSVGAPAGTIEDYSDALDAIVLEDNDWYGLMMVDRTQAKVEEVAEWIETKYKLFITASADANIINQTLVGDTTSVAKTFYSSNYARSAVMYHSLAATEYADAAWFGKCLPYDAGSITWAFKTLSSITVDSLTETQQNNARDKNANVYVEVGGQSITWEGLVSAEEFIDIIRGIDWIRSEIQADVYYRLVTQLKVPYTDPGITSIESVIAKALQAGVDVNFLASFTTTVPRAADCSSTDKANRILKNVKFTGVVAGAIHAVEIAGIVTV